MHIRLLVLGCLLAAIIAVLWVNTPPASRKKFWAAIWKYLPTIVAAIAIVVAAAVFSYNFGAPYLS